MNSRQNFQLRPLDKYNQIWINGVICKRMTNEHAVIPFLGTDVTPIISIQDPIARLLIRKAHLKSTSRSLNPVHGAATNALACLTTGRYGVLLVHAEDMITRFIHNCVPCKKEKLLFHQWACQIIGCSQWPSHLNTSQWTPLLLDLLNAYCIVMTK